jgi:DNA-binding GntR family transcriptional regulator
VADDQREGVAPYQRIAAALRQRIESGELAPGDMLPSITRISQEEGVSKGTAVKALDVLRREGLTYSIQGWGTFVKARD